MERWAHLLIKTGPNREKQNMIWNMIGSFCYAFASMVLSFLVMRIAGEEQGGIFAFGFSTLGQQMFLLAYFGIRPFQVTDVAGEYRFGDYRLHRWLTCGAAILLGGGYLLVCGYVPQKAWTLFLLIGYKVIDGFADVYESEFQRQGYLYLTGKSNAFRTVLSVGSFLLVLLASGQLLWGCVAAIAAQGTGVFLFDVAVLRCLPGVKYQGEGKRLWPLTSATVLLFLSAFLDFYVFSSAKYAIDAYMGDAASGYFNVIFMPTSIINLAAGFVIRPFLTTLSDSWNQKQFSAFARKLGQISAVIGILSVAAVLAVAVIGRPLLGILEWLLGAAYVGKLTVYHGAFGLIVLGGGFYALLNLYYYALVIMRRQKVIFGIYLVMTAAAAVTANQFVSRGGINGAAWAYLLLMLAMAAGFVLCAWGGWRRSVEGRGKRYRKD